MMARRILPTLALLLLLGMTACDLPQAHGDANAVIVASEEPLWDEIEDPFIDVLEPQIQTIGAERAFRLTWTDPEDMSTWGDMRRFRQLIVIGTADDPWIETALDEVEGDVALAPPQLLQAENVWSRGQVVHIVLLGEGHTGSEALAFAEEILEGVEERFHRYTVNRMFTSGRDTALADSLQGRAGFSLVLPEVYQNSSQDSVYRFRNDNPTPSERIREIGVTWLSPIPDSMPDREALIEWRNEFAEANYHDPQLVETELAQLREISVLDRPALELQAAWSSPPDEWPAGGPFVLRAIPCPDQDRLYLVDAWLYAPGQDKYEYMIQLRTILDSFQCGAG